MYHHVGGRRHTPVICNESREPHTSHYPSSKKKQPTQWGNGGISDDQKHHLKTLGIRRIVHTKFGKFKGTICRKKFGKLFFTFGKLSFGKLSLTRRTSFEQNIPWIFFIKKCHVCHHVGASQKAGRNKNKPGTAQVGAIS